jgi:hypothetical protein
MFIQNCYGILYICLSLIISNSSKTVLFVPKDGPLDVSPLNMNDNEYEKDDLDIAIDTAIERQQQWEYHVTVNTQQELYDDDDDDTSSNDYSPEKLPPSSAYHQYSSTAPTPSKCSIRHNIDNHQDSSTSSFYISPAGESSSSRYGIDHDNREPLHSSRSQVGERNRRLKSLYGASEDTKTTRKSHSFQGSNNRGRRSQSAKSRQKNISTHFDAGIPSWISK